MASRCLVKTRGIDLDHGSLDLCPPFCNLLGPFIRQAQKKAGIRIVLWDRGRNLSQDSSLARLWWCHDEGTLPKAQRHKKGHRRNKDWPGTSFQGDTAVRMD